MIAAFLFTLPQGTDSSVAYQVPDSGGDSVLVLDRRKAKAAGLSPNSTGLSAGVGSEVIPDERLSGVSLGIGNLRVVNETVVMRPEAAEGCIFGVGILRNYAVQIDYVSPRSLYTSTTILHLVRE